jgi:hypothetical protein
MPQLTINALQSGGYSLYGFKGVQTTLGGGAPLVWIQSQKFSLTTVVSWQEQYQAYTTTDQIIPNGQITASAAYNINLGETLNVTSPTGSGTVVTGGIANAISVNNETTSPLTCGISQAQGSAGTPTPLCAFPLYGGGLDAMAPIELVLLEFATPVVNTGTVITQAFSQAVLIDLTSSSQVAVSFDINTGWSGNDNPAVTFFPPGTDLAQLLLVAQ